MLLYELFVTRVFETSSVGDGRQLFLVHVGLLHGWFFLLCFRVRSHGVSEPHVGVGYALRVSPAVTRLTVYRRPQVFGTHQVPDRNAAWSHSYSLS